MADPGADPSYFSLFVGDLPPEVHDHFLESFFRQYFPSVRSAKVMTDPMTGRSKGFGFVRFGLEAERDRAVVDMNGVFISSRPVRVSIATARRVDGGQIVPGGGSRLPGGLPGGGGGGSLGDNDPHNTTLFIGGLATGVTEDQLRGVFGRYGEIIYTKIPPGKGCGFVQFIDRQAAEYAMQEVNGQIIGGSAVRISWGKSTGKGGGGGGYGGGAGGGGGASTSGPYGAGNYGGGYGSYGYDASTFGVGYGQYDPYSAASYGSYGADPYAAYYSGAYQSAGMGTSGGGGGGGTGTAGGSVAPPTAVYDPVTTISVEKQNAAYVQRHMPGYTGSYMGLVSS